ncbi:MscL family protein [Fructobacillus ficulneus]|uniref:Large-conductance mechanosensitive channel n=1 Tax=Fructobacillus ficulneus TaxID=157463 RepID=A0A0K8MGY8_9LACO|nr:MscL family protein [Fructobacillus ficulneus]GAO99139.1 large-conductance mechanosensitive channel [Fructobacillus ficulneus]
MSRSSRKKELREQRDTILEKSSAGLVSFRRFLFAPNLLTFVISVVVGNAFGSAIKDLVTLAADFLLFLWRWIFTANHPLYFNATENAWNTFVTSFLTMLFIALAVYYTIQLINNRLIGSDNEKWGYDGAHQDMLMLQRLQKENNELVKKNNQLQREVLKALSSEDDGQSDK